jgi:hypothetical protein
VRQGVDPITDERRRTMAKIAVEWAANDLKEKAFEQALGEGKATLLDHPLPNGGVLSRATDEQIALAAKRARPPSPCGLATRQETDANASYPLSKPQPASLTCSNG